MGAPCGLKTLSVTLYIRFKMCHMSLLWAYNNINEPFIRRYIPLKHSATSGEKLSVAQTTTSSTVHDSIACVAVPPDTEYSFKTSKHKQTQNEVLYRIYTQIQLLA